MSDDEPAFDDAGGLQPEVSDADFAATVAALVRADLLGDAAGAVLRAFAAGGDRLRFAFAWNDAMEIDGLGDWIEADAGRRARAEALAMQLSPPDPGPRESAAAIAAIQGFDEWHRHAYSLLVVPGYTPASLKEPSADLHPVALRRVELAARDFQDGAAPFILVSGGAVYPRGTPYAEAIGMKAALLGMGLPEDRVLVDARARHSTTNLRNAGRLMIAHGMARAMIVTVGGGIAGSDLFGQDFYFAHPVLSTFHRRSEKELGYRVGDLAAAGEQHIVFTPSPAVRRVGFRDALDP